MVNKVKLEMTEEPERIEASVPEVAHTLSTADFPISEEARRIERAVIAREVARHRQQRSA